MLVITGAGGSFCAGWDLHDAAEFDQIGDWDEFRVGLYNSPGECGYTRRADIFKPVIAAVNGYAFAAGLETALLADIRIAAEWCLFLDGAASTPEFGLPVRSRHVLDPGYPLGTRAYRPVLLGDRPDRWPSPAA